MNAARPILLVEDNPADVDLTRRAFRKSKLGNELVVAKDGAEALEVLFGRGAWEGRRVHPAVILLDLKLPKVDGLEVLRAVRADPTTCTLPVVVLTSSSEDEAIIESYNLGANSFIRKPVGFEQFARAAQQLGMYWVVLNELPSLHP